MSECNWDNIIIETDISNYLSLGDMIELSQTSNYLRANLFQTLFNNINFHKLCKFNYFSSFISREDLDPSLLKEESYKISYETALFNDFESKDLKLFYNPYRELASCYKIDRSNFRTRLQVYKGQLKALHLREIYDYYHILFELPALFLNLQSLTLTSSTLPLNLCQHLFNNLRNLKLLTLIGIKFLQSSINPVKLKFTKSIEKLTLGYCHMQYILNDSDSIPYLLGEGLQLEINEFPLTPINLPNLENLTYFGFLGTSNSIVEFLRLNPQVKFLTLEGISLNLKVIELLSLKHVLTNLNLVSDFYLRGDEDGEIPKLISRLETIKFLEICLPIKSTNYRQLTVIFPKIDTLVINIDLAKFFNPSNQLLSIITQFKEFINQFNNIKKLKLNFYWLNYHIRNYFSKNIPNNQELDIFQKLFCYILENELFFINLKTIQFGVKNSNISFKGNFTASELGGNKSSLGWKIKGFSKYLTVYRL